MEKELIDYDRFGSLLESRKEKIEGGLMMKVFSEETFLKNRPDWEKDLFRELNTFLLSEIKKGIKIIYLETYCRYSYNNLMFCKMKSTSEALKIYLKLRYQEIENPQKWVRDYEPVSRQTWVEISIREADVLTEGTILIDDFYNLAKNAFNRVMKAPQLSKVSIKKPEILPDFIVPTKIKIDLEISTDGFCQVGLRVHKSQLQKILGKLIE